MAVPGRRNGEVEDDQGDNALFEDHDLDESDDIPPHLCDLFEAVKDGDITALRRVLDTLSGGIDEPVEDGDTALHLACLYGHFPCVQLLLERGANLEVRDEDGATPLHDACAGGYTEIVQLLFNKATGPEQIKRMLETVDAEGDTPLHHAARGQHVEVIRLLLVAGASCTQTNLFGHTPTDLPDPGSEAKRILEVNTNSAVCQ